MVEAGFTPLAENPVEMGMGGGNPLLDRALGFGKYGVGIQFAAEIKH